VCNLDCAYCFFLSKELLYPGSRFRMADELLETYIRQLIEAHRAPEVTIAWQGGEPTLMGSTSSAARWSSRNALRTAGRSNTRFRRMRR
jgi:sulfatase maturation enzyme AslB (radical SAM superfamily)